MFVSENGGACKSGASFHSKNRSMEKSAPAPAPTHARTQLTNSCPGRRADELLDDGICRAVHPSPGARPHWIGFDSQEDCAAGHRCKPEYLLWPQLPPPCGGRQKKQTRIAAASRTKDDPENPFFVAPLPLAMNNPVSLLLLFCRLLSLGVRVRVRVIVLSIPC